MFAGKKLIRCKYNVVSEDPLLRKFILNNLLKWVGLTK